MKKAISLLCLTFLLSSCSNVFYQVYKVDSEQGKVTDSQFIFEDDNCRITYMLWSEGGNPGFNIWNKTDQILVVNLDSSFFVLNGIAYDYYKNRSITRSNSVATSFSYNVYPLATYRQRNNRSTTSAYSSSLEFEERPKILVPPKSSKNISDYTIYDGVLTFCDLAKRPGRKSNNSLKFSKESTPILFLNVISYSIGQTHSKIETPFYVSEISNFKETDIRKATYPERCGKKSIEPVMVNKEKAPNKFYNIYGIGSGL